MAAGHGGQILVADSTAGLLSGLIFSIWDRDGCVMCQRRWGVPGPSTRTADGLSAVAGVDTNPGNLRPAITSLIGRDAEVANLQAALGSHRLVTLTGWVESARPGLRWKSRRSLPMNFQTGSGFSSWRRSLIRLRYPMRWRRCWASLSNPARLSSESVAAALEGRSRLLVFDNCEHVVDSVADLVAGDPRGVGHREGSGHQS